MPISREKKEAYFARLTDAFSTYNKLFIITADNVGSLQFANVRIALRGKAEVIMGKNTMMRKVLKNFLAENPGHALGQLMPKIVKNMGFVFTNGDLGEVREIIKEHRVPAPAKAGAVAPVDVHVPAGPTGCDPGQTAWFQALNVPTKISRGQIEIVSNLKLINAGDKVGSSEAALLQKLSIHPFEYGLIIDSVFDDGSLFDAAVLDLSDDDIINKFFNGVNMVAQVSLAIAMPTLASLPHSLQNALYTCIQVAVATDYSFEEAKKYKDMLNMSPEELAALAKAAGGAGGDAAAAEEEAPVEEEEAAEVDVGAGGLFGGDDDAY